MNRLLKLQLKKVYGKEFNLEEEDAKFKEFIKLVKQAYEDYEEEEKQLENILDINANELEELNKFLIDQKELLKSVENSMDDAVFYKNLQHKYIGCNKKFENFIGLSEKKLIGKTDYDFFDKNTAYHYWSSNEEIIHNKKKVIYKQWVEYNGKKVYVLTSKTPLINIDEKVIGIVGIARDITSEYKLQKDIEHKNIMLIQQNKLVSMGEMIANIAHQWRQPLNTLGLLIQKMGIFYKQGIIDEKTIDSNITEALTIMDGMSETIDDFRIFFSNDRVLENFNLQESILKSQNIIKSTLKINNIEFIIDIKNKYFVNGYKNEFFQVILNLLNNAVEVLIQDDIITPKIKINVRDEKYIVIIEVWDNANGILNSNISKIFDPYFTTKDNGTGLGLYMSKIIIEEHMKGKLTVSSTTLGTTFTIELKGGAC